MRSVLAIGLLCVAAHAFGVEPDPRVEAWRFSTDLYYKSIGPEKKNPPKHLVPYGLEGFHTDRELHPQYQFELHGEAPSADSIDVLHDHVSRAREKTFVNRAKLFEHQGLKSKEGRHELSRQFAGEMSHVNIRHVDKLSDKYQLVSVAYYINGKMVYRFREVNPIETEAEKQTLQVYSGLLDPATNTLSVRAIYRGHGEGMFEYLRDYRVNLLAHYEFNSVPGKVHDIEVTALEQGRFFTSFKDRPKLAIVMSP